jgi:hypothetical protein
VPSSPQVVLGDAECRPEAHEASDRRGRGSVADELPDVGAGHVLRDDLDGVSGRSRASVPR